MSLKDEDIRSLFRLIFDPIVYEKRILIEKTMLFMLIIRSENQGRRAKEGEGGRKRSRNRGQHFNRQGWNLKFQGSTNANSCIVEVWTRRIFYRELN